MSETNANLSPELLSSQITINFLQDRVRLETKAITKNGQVTAVVDADNNPRDDQLTAEGLLVDKLTMNALSEFFLDHQITFTGHPWTTDGQDDFLGYLSLKCSDLNQALANGAITITASETDPSYYTIDGLEDFVRQYTDTHFVDDEE